MASLLDVLDTVNKYAGTAVDIYKGVTSSYRPTVSATAASMSQPAPSAPVYVPVPASPTSGSLSLPVMLAIVGGAVLLLFVALKK